MESQNDPVLSLATIDQIAEELRRRCHGDIGFALYVMKVQDGRNEERLFYSNYSGHVGTGLLFAAATKDLLMDYQRQLQAAGDPQTEAKVSVLKECMRRVGTEADE
jgi:hypothetical protein